MNLNVLLEAAKYVELQDELKAKQRQIENIGQTQSTHRLQPPPPPPPPLQPRPVSPSHSLLKQGQFTLFFSCEIINNVAYTTYRVFP